MKKIVVAIDGFSSCGKSTMAKELAKAVGYLYVDTGAMYRAVSLYAINNGIMNESNIDEHKLKAVIDTLTIGFVAMPDGTQHTTLNGEDVEHKIRSLEVANGASRVSAIGFVREALVRQQQAMGRQKGIVMDGRDIGTVVFPQAELKVFLTATPEVRAQRRFDELTAKGENVDFNEVLNNIKERDHRDTNRAESPLRQADDALLLDNSYLSKEEQRTKLQAWFIEKSR